MGNTARRLTTRAAPSTSPVAWLSAAPKASSSSAISSSLRCGQADQTMEHRWPSPRWPPWPNSGSSASGPESMNAWRAQPPWGRSVSMVATRARWPLSRAGAGMPAASRTRERAPSAPTSRSALKVRSPAVTRQPSPSRVRSSTGVSPCQARVSRSPAASNSAAVRWSFSSSQPRQSAPASAALKRTSPVPSRSHTCMLA